MTESQTFAPTAPLKTAVLFLVFNRPEVTARVFEAIRKAKPPRLYVAADGPRSDRGGEQERCERVRGIATNVDWPCEVKTLFRKNNLGCKLGVSEGINWFFENEEEGIILEDDCLPSQSFFWFCEGLLEKYKYDSRIGMIAGTRVGNASFESCASYSFSRLVQIWGWATWRRAWQGYDVNLCNWPDFEKSNGLRNAGIDEIICCHLEKTYENAHLRRVDTWDYQWSFRCVSEGMLTVFPRKNLILNIGFGPDATHTTTGGQSGVLLEDFALDVDPIAHPKFIIPNRLYDRRKISRPSLIGKFANAVKRNLSIA